MALGGGTFLVQNKILPGAYINFVSRPRALGGLGERGTVCIPMELDWGYEGMITVESGEFQKSTVTLFGYDFLSEKMREMRELFLYASKVKVYRLNSGDKATATLGSLKVTARYGGVRGNDILIVISENLEDSNLYDVKTYLDGEEMDFQTVSEGEELVDNDFVSFSGQGELQVTAGMSLSGGKNKEVTGSDYSKFLDEAEAEEFQVLAYAGEDQETKSLFEAFTKRMRIEEGVKFVTVLHDWNKADFEGVVSVKNVAAQGAAALVYWVAGAQAGANINESLTNRVYNGELTVSCKLKKSEYEKGISQGEFLFYQDGDKVRVLSDINSFTSFETAKNQDFSSCRVIRVLDSVANDIARIFSQYYLGKQSNNANGRNLFKAELINYHEQLQNIEAIEGFRSDDIIVEQGSGKRDVVVYVSLMPTDAMEKLYMKVEVA